MCLAIPARIVEIHTATDTATVALGEVRKQVSLALVDDVAAGDFVRFDIQLDAVVPGELTGVIAFGNSDPDEDPFDFGVGGTVGQRDGAVADEGGAQCSGCQFALAVRTSCQHQRAGNAQARDQSCRAACFTNWLTHSLTPIDGITD